MKDSVCAAFAFSAAVMSWAFGGWDTALAALVICMAVD